MNRTPLTTRPRVDVEAGDHPDRAHAATPSSTVNRPSTRALPVITPLTRRGGPSSLVTTSEPSVSMSCTEETPPDAMTGSAVARQHFGQAVDVGPREHPVAVDGGEHDRGESGVGELGEHLDDRPTAGLLPAAHRELGVVRSAPGR